MLILLSKFILHDTLIAMKYIFEPSVSLIFLYSSQKNSQQTSSANVSPEFDHATNPSRPVSKSCVSSTASPPLDSSPPRSSITSGLPALRRLTERPS